MRDWIFVRATSEVIEKIIAEHLIGNKIVEEYVFHKHPWPFSDTSQLCPEDTKNEEN